MTDWLNPLLNLVSYNLSPLKLFLLGTLIRTTQKQYIGLHPPWLTVNWQNTNLSPTYRKCTQSSFGKTLDETRSLYANKKNEYLVVWSAPGEAGQQSWFSAALQLVDRTNCLSGSVPQKMLEARVVRLRTGCSSFLVLPRSCWSWLRISQCASVFSERQSLSQRKRSRIRNDLQCVIV